MIVVDVPVISWLVMPGEFSELADRVKGLEPDWIAPSLWASEFRNVVRTYLVAGELNLSDALACSEAAEALMAGRTFPVAGPEVLALTAASGCTAYDCEYVALAKSAGLTLVTPDREILRAFPETAVHPESFAARQPS